MPSAKPEKDPAIDTPNQHGVGVGVVLLFPGKQGVHHELGVRLSQKTNQSQSFAHSTHTHTTPFRCEEIGGVGALLPVRVQGVLWHLFADFLLWYES
jgi:hypothetical protein